LVTVFVRRLVWLVKNPSSRTVQPVGKPSRKIRRRSGWSVDWRQMIEVDLVEHAGELREPSAVPRRRHGGEATPRDWPRKPSARSFFLSRAVCPQTLLNRKRPRYDGRSRNRILLFVITWKGRCGPHVTVRCTAARTPRGSKRTRKRKKQGHDRAAVVCSVVPYFVTVRYVPAAYLHRRRPSPSMGIGSCRHCGVR
jgi:hypothetical protein